MAQDPTDPLLGVGIEMLALRFTSDQRVDFILPDKEYIERSARLGAEVPIMRYGGRARVPTKSRQPQLSVACEIIIALLFGDVC